MRSRYISRFWLTAGLALAASTGLYGACSGTTTITCAGGPAAAIHITGQGAGTHFATPYPSIINVNGAPPGSTVSTVSLTLYGYTTSSANGSNGRYMGLLLASPSGRNLEIMRQIGKGSAEVSNLTIVIQDGTAPMPSACVNTNPVLVSGTYAPSAYSCPGQSLPDYSVNGGPSRQHSAHPNGNSTLHSTSGVFNGDNPNGNWGLYLVDDDTDADVSFSGWSLTITVSGASSPSTVTLTPNPTTAFTAAPNSSIVLTARAGAGATGGILFKDGSSTLTCSEGPQPRLISGGRAVCTATFSTEGSHSLSANYAGDGRFVSGSGTATVYVQNHATNSGSTYCNSGTIKNNGRSDLALTNTNPYPSVIFVGDGMNTDIAKPVDTVSVTLKNFSSAGVNGMHVMLMAPDGAHAHSFWSNTGSTASPGDYTFVDGRPPLPNSALSPGPYGPTARGLPPENIALGLSKGDSHSKTFQGAFHGAPGHGAWSLFLYNASGATAVTNAAGGWCLTITTVK